MSLRTSNSPHTVQATADRVVAALQSRGIQLFARVDHGGGARAAGLDLADEELLIFGDPRAGTPLMQADARVGYELPLRLLVWRSDAGTLVGFRPPSELTDGYEISDRAELLERMGDLLDALVAESVAAS